MGSFIEINDTLQISKEQGFPKELDINIHLKKSFQLADFKDRIFEFRNKPDIRMYKQPPVRNFFVENINGKWIYWGRVHIVEIVHDYVHKTTSGKYKIIYLNSPEEMKQSFHLIDLREEFNYFKTKSR